MNLAHPDLPMTATPSPSLTQRAYELLREDLMACRFEPGDPLRISELCTRLAVSQGAVREALSRLTSEGLVEARPQRGFRVMPNSAADLRDLTDARVDIEKICLRRAIAAGDLNWEARIVAVFHRLSRTPTIDEGPPRRFNAAFVALHDEFFDALVAGCDSPWLSRMRQMLSVQERRYHGRLRPPVAGERDLIAELRAVMDAALARDAELACSLIAAHMQRSAETLIAQMGG